MSKNRKRKRLWTGIQGWNPSSLIFLVGGIILCLSIVYALWPDRVYAIYVPRQEEFQEYMDPEGAGDMQGPRMRRREKRGERG